MSNNGMIKTWKCQECGKELRYKAEKCGDCAKKALQQIFKENPEVKQAYEEAIEETFSPENRKKMADDITKIMGAFQALQKKARES